MNEKEIALLNKWFSVRPDWTDGHVKSYAPVSFKGDPINYDMVDEFYADMDSIKKALKGDNK